MFFRYLISTFSFLFGAIWALVGTIFVVVGAVWFYNDYRIHKHGIPAEAVVVEKMHTTGKNNSSNYSIKYVFHDKSGTEQIRTESVSWETWRSYEDGDKLRVTYLADKPDKSLLSAEVHKHWWVGGAAFAAFGSMFAGVGWFLVIRAVFKTAGRLRLLRTGMPVYGEITGILQDYNTRINGRHPFYLTYQCVGPDGRTYEGRSVNIPRKLEQRLQQGGRIKVVFEQGNYDNHEVDLFDLRQHAGAPYP